MPTGVRSGAAPPQDSLSHGERPSVVLFSAKRQPSTYVLPAQKVVAEGLLGPLLCGFVLRLFCLYFSTWNPREPVAHASSPRMRGGIVFSGTGLGKRWWVVGLEFDFFRRDSSLNLRTCRRRTPSLLRHAATGAAVTDTGAAKHGSLAPGLLRKKSRTRTGPCLDERTTPLPGLVAAHPSTMRGFILPTTDNFTRGVSCHNIPLFF